MTRQLKPIVTAHVHDERLRLDIPIMLDRNTLGFYAVLPGGDERACGAESADECKRLVKERIRQMTKPDWKPIIAVSVSMGKEHYLYRASKSYVPPEVGFEMERFEVADVGTAKLRRDWPRDDPNEAERREQDPLYGASRDYGAAGETVRIPYPRRSVDRPATRAVGWRHGSRRCPP